jgi:riboflavin synthase
MFTGIVEEVGIVEGIDSKHITINAKRVIENLKPGDSIAINGTCLTVTVVEKGYFSVDIMPETTRLTNLGKLHYRDKVNLECALMTGSRVGGHFVQGHIDDVGHIMSIVPEAGAMVARISASYYIMKYIVKKGFVAVDGCSLTVVDYDDISFSVSLVAYTLKNTILGERKVGDKVNIEVDIMGKYVEKFNQPGKNGVTWEVLQEYGFLQAR